MTYTNVMLHQIALKRLEDLLRKTRAKTAGPREAEAYGQARQIARQMTARASMINKAAGEGIESAWERVAIQVKDAAEPLLNNSSPDVPTLDQAISKLAAARRIASKLN